MKLKYIATINRSSLPEDTDPNLAFGYIDISSVSSSGEVAVPSEMTRFADAPLRARRLAPPGSTVVSTVRTYLRAVASVPQTDEPLVFSTGFATLEARDSVEPRFLAYACRSEQFIASVASRSVGVSYPAISAGDLANIDVPLPTLDEQRRIADFLDAETARLDRLIAARRRQLDALTERNLAIVTEAFMAIDDAIEIRLGHLARIQSGLTVDGGRELVGDVVTRPYLRVANVQSGHLDLADVTEITVTRQLAAGATLRPGDVLMTEGGDLDKLGRGTVWNGQLPGCLHQNHVFAVRPDPERILPEYLALFTRAVPARMHFERTGTKTTNLASTSSSKIKDLRVPLAPLHVQRRLCEHVATELTLTERLASAIASQLDLIEERRQALITAAVTGQFDITTAGRDARESVVP